MYSAQSSNQKATNTSNLFEFLDKLAFYCGLASYLCDIAIYPLDTLNTRLKASRLESISLKQAFSLFYRQDGIRSFYKGVHSAFPMSFANVFVYFYIYEKMNQKVLELQKSYDSSSKSIITFILPFISAAVAESSVMSWYVPCDVIRTRLQSNETEYKYRGMIDGLIKTAKKEGFARFFAASHLYISSQVIYTSIEFGMYEFLRKRLLLARDKKAMEVYETLCVTMVSGGIAAMIINPLDLLLVRYQVVDTRFQKLRLVHMTKDIIKEEGMKAFYKGMSARITYAMMYSLIMFPIYEKLRTLYGVDMLDFQKFNVSGAISKLMTFLYEQDFHQEEDLALKSSDYHQGGEVIYHIVYAKGQFVTNFLVCFMMISMQYELRDKQFQIMKQFIVKTNNFLCV